MNLTELLQVLWRRKFVVLATFLSVMALAALALAAQPKIYEATSTLNLTPVSRDPQDDNDGLFLLSQMNVIVPIYAEGANTGQTFNSAAEKLGSPDLGKVAIRTFRDSTILKIRVRHEVPARAQAAAQAMSDALLERVDRGEIGLRQLQLTQIDRPGLPTDPVSPRPGLTYAVAMVLGLGFGLGAAILRDTLGRRVDTARDLSQAVGAPCFSELPTVRAVARASTARELHGVMFDGANAALAEAFRDLHTNLQFAEGNVRSILISSPDGRHGKTTVAAGLAMTIARAGARTVLVDGDIRRGRIGAMFGREGALGLFDVLAGAPLEDAVRRSGLEKLDVLPAGGRTDDADEALDKHFLPLLQQLESRYDAVVIDGPPVVPVNDARIMARYADCTLLVAGAGALTRRQLRTAVERLTIISVRPRAVILNHSKSRPSASSLAYLRGRDDGPADPDGRLGARGIDERLAGIGGAPGGPARVPGPRSASPDQRPPSAAHLPDGSRPPIGSGLRQGYARHPAAGPPVGRADRDPAVTNVRHAPEPLPPVFGPDDEPPRPLPDSVERADFGERAEHAEAAAARPYEIIEGGSNGDSGADVATETSGRSREDRPGDEPTPIEGGRLER